MKPVIVVHGGAGVIVKEYEERYRSGVKRAALKGYDLLKQGGSALTAVEEAVVVMEDDSNFNAGYGSVLNEEGEVEMDAIIMDGKNLATGAVSAVRCIANPIKLARLVMEKTDHVLLTANGAALFAKAQGVPEVPGEKLITERSKERWRKNIESNSNPVATQVGLGTVGAVAIDSEGNLACATSTGGISNKMVGRVGDSACVVSDAARMTTPSGSRSRHSLDNAHSGNPLNTAWTTTYLHSPLPDFGKASFTLSLQPVPAMAVMLITLLVQHLPQDTGKAS
ncbi:isoaspartyl peptidase/L-asparaginase isoform X2 [Ascaphus truei]|uniref:isoaspartyl peptidase/L-asparaginase isoform X2 n=1 Tax=Ascaphus truei TaxID=8439 RepID=UPI003F59A9D6